MFPIPVAVHLFLFDKGRILLHRRHSTGNEDGDYSTVAGHVEGGEQLKAAMIREAKEEAGIEILPADLEVIGVLHSMTDKEYVCFFLKAVTWTGEVRNMEPKQCGDLRWFDITIYQTTSFHTCNAQLETSELATFLTTLDALERATPVERTLDVARKEGHLIRVYLGNLLCQSRSLRETRKLIVAQSSVSTMRP